MGGAGVRIGAHAVDLQAVVIVHGDGFPGHAPQDARLHPEQTRRQASDPAFQAGRFRNQFHQFLQGIDVRAAQVDRLRIGLPIIQGIAHPGDDIADINRSEAGVGAAEGEEIRRKAQQCGKTANEMVAGTKNQGRAKTRDLGHPAELEQRRFRLGLASQVLAARIAAGAERAHLKQPRNLVRVAGRHQFLRQSDMRFFEGLPAHARFVEDADQVDDDVHAFGMAHERPLFVNVRLHQVQCGENQQGAMAKALPGQHSDFVALRHQAADQRLTDKSGPP